MGTKKFPSELSSRGTVKVTDKLIIHNIDTGATEYTTVAGLLAALSSYGNVGIGTTVEPTQKLQVVGNVFINGSGGGTIKLYGDYSGSPSDPGIVITNHSDVTQLSFNSNGGDLNILGNLGIGTIASSTSKLQVVGFIEYADNAAALSAGLTAGAFYRTGDILKVVH
jgi:hypothetical protein